MLENCLIDNALMQHDFLIILSGDLNSRTSNDGQHRSDISEEAVYESGPVGYKRCSQDSVTNGYGKMLLNMCTTLSLTIMNGTCNGDCEGRFTYIGDSGCSVVDYFLLSGELYDNLFDSCSLHVVERIESDHLPVVFSVDFLTQNNDQDCEYEDVHVEKYV